MDQTWWKGQESGLGDDDEAVLLKIDKDFHSGTHLGNRLHRFVLFYSTRSGSFRRGGGLVTVLLDNESISRRRGTRGVCMYGDPPYISWIALLLIMVGRRNQGTPARAAQQGSTGLPGYAFGARPPSLRGLGLLSEKRRLSEAVYLETDKDGGRCNDPRPLEGGGGVGARYRFCG